jgi:cyclopropane fatty-acyl-phospholipid synthase-like methyltransferase
MRWNTPLSEAHASLLLHLLEVPGRESVLDLGCGWGELLLRSVALGLSGRDGECAGVGVDTDPSLLERGRALARERGLEDRVRFVHAGAETWTEPADRLLCVGATHAWGSTDDALVALRKLVRPGGRLLFGDGCWETEPTKAAERIFGDSVVSLVHVVHCAVTAGWRVLHLSTADQREWDEFESSWRRGREAWLDANPDSPGGGSVRDELDARLTEYVRDYRGVLGFCYLILGAS